ncbi:MAG: VanZ family protein [Clostridia bacterium]|nr:VanZ family protein [Clostridia bacterium]
MWRIKAWLPAALWMGVIFMMSAMPGDASAETSGTLVRLLMGAISFLFGEEAAAAVSIDTIHLLIRKGAHMAEYAVLFLLYHRALRLEGAKRPCLMALMLCAAYASTDELHQAFVAGRGPSVIDVGVDTLGAGMAWVWTAAWIWLKEKRRMRR